MRIMTLVDEGISDAVLFGEVTEKELFECHSQKLRENGLRGSRRLDVLSMPRVIGSGNQRLTRKEV